MTENQSSPARQKMEELGRKLQTRQSEASAIGAVYRFVLTGDGGGSFVVNLKDDVGVREGEGPTSCTLRLSATDFVDLLEGRASGQALFFGQRLQVEGDVSLALKLQTLVDLLK